jgi:hypothetical protein
MNTPAPLPPCSHGYGDAADCPTCNATHHKEN